LNQESSVPTIPEIAAEQRAERRARQEGKLPKFKLCMATPFYMSQQFCQFGDSMVDTARYLDGAKIPFVKLSLPGDSYIDRAKNTLVAEFLESDCTDLLMIDSDLKFSPEAVGRMCRHPQEVVAGCFPMKNAWGTFAGSLLPDINGQVPDLESAVEAYDRWCLFRAYLLPGGFLRIKRSVLERFADHYPDNVYQCPMANPDRPDRIYTAFFECVRHNYTRYGEDGHFCRLLREMEIPLWIDPFMEFTHYGIKGWEGRLNDKLVKPKEEFDAILLEQEKLAKDIRVVKLEMPAVPCEPS
jgi:hypothetical protein